LETSLIPAIERGLAVTERIGLLGASVTQHPEFEALLDYLSKPQFDRVRLSIASVRTNTVTVKLAQTLAKRDTRSLTIAVESGSQRLRQIVNKKLDNDEIIQAAVNAKAGGLSGLKLYGMAGIPGEEPEDLDETVKMMRSLKKSCTGVKANTRMQHVCSQSAYAISVVWSQPASREAVAIFAETTETTRN
jgi:radical SAM superfamily enzyme YgiQ (UPF0313 family)